MRKAILFTFISFSLIVFHLVTPIVNSGYEMYKEAIQEKELSTLVTTIRSNDNFVTIDEVSPKYIKALIQSEDHRFYNHDGVDLIAITRAMYKNVLAGKYKEGGSTITQQLAKNLYFSFGKKLDRKVAELFVVHDLESKYTKNEILELYINIIYFGENCYGIQQASNHYFNKAPSQLNEDEIDALVYTIKSPNNYNPNKLKLTFAN
ncbi:biosynthetic peptidoglycan transglycosylase [Anaerorhabdus sp.]|uniref:biosynthetic peptidoglycan transglycosylase n=1 Tax=Anaerorhabdus sp. TaxID=1872524 RepID=UPI002FC8DE75